MVNAIPEQNPSDGSDSKYKGVRKRKWGKWVSEIRLPNSRERIWLGSYDSAEKAALAFDAALFCLRGRTAKFNFPDNPPEIARGRSLSPAEIQAAAARFANSEEAEAAPRKRRRRIQSENSSSEQSNASETPVESPSTSVVSDGTAQLDANELTWDGPFLDLLMNVGSGSDYGIFPGFDDLQNDFLAPSEIPNLDYGGGYENFNNFDGVSAQDSFLWNF